MNIKEIEVLKKIKSGVSQRELAEQLSVSRDRKIVCVRMNNSLN